MENLENISIQIENIHSYFSDYANRQVDYAYTLRNWLIGMYLFEVEQKGKDRADYGEKLYRNLALKLKEKKIKGMSFTENQVVEIVQSATEQFVFDKNLIVQSLIEQSENAVKLIATGGLSQEVFVSKYKLQLPSEAELRAIIEKDVKNFGK